MNGLLHALQCLCNGIPLLVTVLPHDESKGRLHGRFRRPAPLAHLTPCIGSIQMQLMTLLALPLQSFLASHFGQLGRPRVLRRSSGISILTQLTIPAGNPVEPFQSILATLLVRIGGSLVKIGSVRLLLLLPASHILIVSFDLKQKRWRILDNGQTMSWVWVW